LNLTLLVENNIELSSYYSINLQTWVGADSLVEKTSKMAIGILENNPDIGLIITKSRNGLEKSAEILFEYITKSGKTIPLIVIGKSSIKDPSVIHLANGLDIKELVQNTAKAIGVTAQDMAKHVVPDFFPIPISYFLSLHTAIINIYVQDEENQDQYNIKFEQFDEFDQNSIKEVIKLGIGNLYVKKVDRLKFVTNITHELMNKISASELNSDEKITANEMQQSLLQQKLARIGLTDETIAMSQKQIKSMIGMTKKFPSMSKLMSRLLKNKAGYLFKHCQVLTFVCTHLMEHMDWGSDDQIKKICFIAFFHDIMLENDEQAMINSQAELDASPISKAKKDLVTKHAQMAAEIIVKYPGAPMGADVIIRQHHGINHGVGFSEQYSANLSPMSIVFILAEDFTDAVIKAGEHMNVEAKIATMRARYSTQRFQKIIDILEEITI